MLKDYNSSVLGDSIERWISAGADVVDAQWLSFKQEYEKHGPNGFCFWCELIGRQFDDTVADLELQEIPADSMNAFKRGYAVQLAMFVEPWIALNRAKLVAASLDAAA